MSVLIKNMKFPKKCFDCPIHNSFEHKCELYSFDIPARYNYEGATRPEWCELVKIPENHGPLIDKNALFRMISQVDISFSLYHDGMFVDISDMDKILNDLQIIIEAEGDWRIQGGII